MDEESPVIEFTAIGELAETTTQLLALDLHSSGEGRAGRPAAGHEQVKLFILQQARDYVAEVHEGFMLSVRTAQVGEGSELRYLLRRVLTDWNGLAKELGLEAEGAGEVQVERVRRQVLAFGMAAVALGQLPRLPAEQITFPLSYGKPPSYADIAAPHTPGAMLTRIEEVEQMLWQAMASDMQELAKRRYGALRRTYGFFEASALLARSEIDRFGGQHGRPQITLF